MSERHGARTKFAKFEPGSIFVAVLLALPLLLGGCGTSGPRKSTQADSGGRPSSPGRGGYYLDDGPGENPPANLDDIPDAVPRVEPINRATSRPYAVMGRSYTPMTDLAPYRERGLATWYGRRYHGKPTSSGESYDMYRMTAAHTTLPIPSYARVTNVGNGRSVVVRINDRGPFVGERLIDLSYVAAHKLDLLRGGSGVVEVESIVTSSRASAVRGRTEPEPARVSAAAPTQPQAVTTPMVTANAAVTAPAGTPTPAVTTPTVTANAAVTATAVTANPTGHYIQLAAFSVKENADRFLERVRALLDSDQASVNLVPSGALYRIQAGPYADRTAAEQAALRFETILGSAPVLTSPR